MRFRRCAVMRLPASVGGRDARRTPSRRSVLRHAAASVLVASAFARVGWARQAAGIEPFAYRAPQEALDDLRRRLSTVRWPEAATEAGWSQGVPLDAMRSLVEYWRTGYDWRRFEARLNAFPQFRTEIDGLGIHFLHVRSPHADALPLLLTHGWPGSVIEFFGVIGPLTDPVAHGGRAEDAFHVVVPSLPGFGFSDRPAGRGWTTARIARAWATLMERLGYDRYVAQGGDWGGDVTAKMAQQRPPGLIGIHLNFPLVYPDPMPTEGSTPDERRALEAAQRFMADGSGYFLLQSTRPQTVGYALTDSPVGQAAWIYEKFHAWTDNNGTPEDAVPRDAMLDNITLYWLTGTAASSARIYYENAGGPFNNGVIELPVGVSVFPDEIFPAPRTWAARFYRNLIHWNELERGGHFAAFEEPDLFVQELRDCFRPLR